MLQTDSKALAKPPTPPVTVRLANLDDIPGLARLWLEMQRHYDKPVPEAVATEAAGLACNANHMGDFAPRTLVALHGDEIIGAVVLLVSFPAEMLTRALYIRDVYVAASWRRRGVGRAMLRAAAAHTLAHGFSALDWTTDSANDRALRLYESEGAHKLGRIYFRCRAPELQRMASG